MRTLTEDELAAEAEVPVDFVRELVRVGAIVPIEPGRHELRDVPRVAEMRRLEAAGIGLDVVASVIEARFAALEYVGHYYLDPAPRSGRTYAAFAASLGDQAPLLRAVYAAFGLPEPAPEARLRVDEEEVIGEFLAAWRIAGLEPEPYVRAARLLGEGTRRIVEGLVRLWGEQVLASLELQNAPPTELTRIAGAHSARLAQVAPRLLVWLEQRHLQTAVTELNIEGFEEALERAGHRPKRERRPPAIAFVDLSGYTRLTEQAGDEAAARFAARLQELADAAARAHESRVVKLLGDGVMLRFGDAATGIDATLDLVARIASSDLPPAHAGVAAGRVIDRDGDAFGRTVNLAARLSAAAAPGEVLVAGDAVLPDHPALRFEHLGTRDLKGLAEPVAVWRVSRQSRAGFPAPADAPAPADTPG